MEIDNHRRRIAYTRAAKLIGRKGQFIVIPTTRRTYGRVARQAVTRMPGGTVFTPIISPSRKWQALNNLSFDYPFAKLQLINTISGIRTYTLAPALAITKVEVNGIELDVADWSADLRSDILTLTLAASPPTMTDGLKVSTFEAYKVLVADVDQTDVDSTLETAVKFWAAYRAASQLANRWSVTGLGGDSAARSYLGLYKAEMKRHPKPAWSGRLVNRYE